MGAAAGAGRDRLAVWDWEEHGERIAGGNWLVSDAERAAAGRETIAGRSRALLPANRDRAARQYADMRDTRGGAHAQGAALPALRGRLPR